MQFENPMENPLQSNDPLRGGPLQCGRVGGDSEHARRSAASVRPMNRFLILVTAVAADVEFASYATSAAILRDLDLLGLDKSLNYSTLSPLLRTLDVGFSATFAADGADPLTDRHMFVLHKCMNRERCPHNDNVLPLARHLAHLFRAPPLVNGWLQYIAALMLVNPEWVPMIVFAVSQETVCALPCCGCDL